MPNGARFVAVALVACLLIAGPAQANDPRSLVSQSEMDAALAQRTAGQAQDRAAIRALLQRPEVKQLAAAYRLDLGRAEAAVATLSGAELQGLALQAAQADTQLAGGDTIRISLVALLLIVIIVILVAR